VLLAAGVTVAVSSVLALLGASIGQPSKAVAERIPPRDFMVGTTPEGDIWLRGRVGPGMLNQFARVRGKEGRRVILTSSGGSAGDGIAIAELILNNRMHTVVRGACYSACANYLFFAGETKTVEPGGMIGFHGWPRAATEADRRQVADAIRRRRPDATDIEIDVAFQQFKVQSEADMARQTAFYQQIGAPRLPRLMRVLDAGPVDYPSGRAYRGGRLAIVPTLETLERCFGVTGIVAYYRPATLEPIDWASPRAPRSSDDLKLVWTPDPSPDCTLFDRPGPETRPNIERREARAPHSEPERPTRRIRVLNMAAR